MPRYEFRLCGVVISLAVDSSEMDVAVENGNAAKVANAVEDVNVTNELQ